MEKQQRATFSFDKTVSKKLSQLAKEGDTSKTEILRRAITLYDFFEKNQGEDGHIKLEKPNGDKVELIMP